MRLRIKAILWILRTGAPWRDLPASFGPRQTNCSRFREWKINSLYQHILSKLSERTDLEYLLIDSSASKLHAHGANPEGGQLAQAIGRSKGRKLRQLGEELVRQIEQAWKEPQEAWARKRLQVVRLIGQQELKAAQIMKVCDVSRQTLFTYRDAVVKEGVEGLLKRKWGGGPRPVVRGMLRQEFVKRLEEGKFRQASDARAWIRKRTRKNLSESGVRKILRRLGGRLKMPRKSHAKKNKTKMEAFKANLVDKLKSLAGNEQSVRLWVLDEHRYGLLPVICRVWARRGTRVTAPYQTRYKWGYLHEALEVDGSFACELCFTPAIDRDIHAIFPRQIADSDPKSLHVIIEDQAGFHLPENDPRIPPNVRLLPLPPYSPELNAVERFGGLIKAAVSNRLYPTLEKLQAHIEAVARKWSAPDKVSGLIHQWLLEKANSGVPA